MPKNRRKESMTATILAILQKEIRLADELLQLEKQKSHAIISANMENLKKYVQMSEKTANRLTELQIKRLTFSKKNLTLSESIKPLPQSTATKSNPSRSEHPDTAPKNSLQSILEALHQEDPKIPIKELNRISTSYRETVSQLGNQITYNQKILKRSNSLIRNLLNNIKDNYQKNEADKTYRPRTDQAATEHAGKSNHTSLILEAKA